MKKLRQARDLVRRIEFKLSRLRKHGYRYKDTGSAGGGIYINAKKRVVIKASFLLAKKKPRNSIPTVFLWDEKRRVNYGKRYGRIVIQPLANTRNSKLAFIRLWDRGVRGEDFKESNVAFYRRKPVHIDW